MSWFGHRTCTRSNLLSLCHGLGIVRVRDLTFSQRFSVRESQTILYNTKDNKGRFKSNCPYLPMPGKSYTSLQMSDIQKSLREKPLILKSDTNCVRQNLTFL